MNWSFVLNNDVGIANSILTTVPKKITKKTPKFKLRDKSYVTLRLPPYC